MSTAAMPTVFEQILNTYNLSIANKRWLAEHLIQYANEEEKLQPYSMSEINAMIDEAEADIAAGRVYSHDEMEKMMDDFVAQYA